LNDSDVLLEAMYEADDCLIGALLIEATTQTRDALIEVSGIVEPGDFKHPLNQTIFKAMCDCGKPPHQINTAQQLADTGTLDKHAIAHMSHCIAITPCSLDYLDYAKAVKYYSEVRQAKISPGQRQYTGFEV